MSVTGSLGFDWLKTHGAVGEANDTLLRAWRDDLERQLRSRLGLDADFTIGGKTHFVLPPNSDHTAIEIEAFARRALDSFLNRQ